MTAAALILKFWPYILTGIGLLFGAWKIDRNATNRERNKQKAKEAQARDIADQVDNDVGALPADLARKELGKWSK